MKTTRLTIAVIFALSSSATFADNNNTQADSIKDAISSGKVSVNLRYRAEDVSQDNPLEDALASTLRSRITFNSKTFNDFSVLAEIDNVSIVGSDDNYNSLRNGIGSYSVVADPEATDINQIALSYTGFDNTKVTYGRQRINLGNQRFVGGVAWRQNEQTYDGLTIINNSLPNSKFTYGYTYNINSILDSNVKTNNHLLDYLWSGSNRFSLSTYAYLLDFKDNQNASTSTLGARIQNAKKSPSNFLWAAEFAKQSDYADSNKDLSANYYLLEGGYKTKQWTTKLGREVLSGDASNSGLGFQTPLATKHKFQGWADLFLGTPDAGVEDTYVSINTQWAGNKIGLTYHDFQAEAASTDYGSEIDFVISRKISKNYSVALKYADYSADDFAVDTRKIWLTLGAKY